MKVNNVESLRQEVLDVLPAGRVGLYEFIWFLRSDDGVGTLTEWKAIAHATLRLLLADGSRHLVRMHWPGFDEFPLPADYQVTDADFDDIGEDGWYVALSLREDGDE